jgi:hypothetical protein
VTGHDKAEMFPRLCQGDVSIPAGRISRHQSIVMVDRDAATLKENQYASRHRD